MKVISAEEVDGKTELTVERTIMFFFKKSIKYIAVRNLVGDYYEWVQAPNHTIVPTAMSFQLDTWKKLHDTPAIYEKSVLTQTQQSL
jgi:hypothetical protein